MDQTLLERVNPVFNTAKMTVFQLAKAGDKDAVRIAEKLGISFEQTQNSATSTAGPEQIKTGIIMLEARYRTMAAMAEKTGFETLIDLPCGYTPRAIEFSRRNKKYIGLDLPAAINEAEPIIMNCIDEDDLPFVKFCGVDATNITSLKKALEGVEGPLCITTEGLMMYFTDSEVGTLCDNISQILRKKGGCWLIADPEASLQYILTIQPLCGDRFMEIMMNSKKNVQDKPDVAVGNNSLIIDPRGDVPANIKKAMMFLASHGLRAERLTVGDYMPELESLKDIPTEQAETIKQNMSKCAYWKITPFGNNTKYDTTDLKEESFDIEANEENGELYLQLKGRVDTLTAPHLLTLFDRVKAEHEIISVIIDCSELEYISSAGLRVLLIMKKGTENGVKLRNINLLVKEILEQTGFDSILEIECE